VSLAGNTFGRLAPNTRYWLALLPGATFTVTPSSHYNGVLVGGIIDEKGSVVRNAVGDLYTTRELGSEMAAGDKANNCSSSSALKWLRSQSYWATVDGATGRYRSSTGVLPYNLVRAAMVLYGREVWF
jgi:hypothetical protein